MDKIQVTEYAKRQIADEIRTEISIIQSNTPETEWEFEYQRGFVDGMYRIIELLENE